MPDDPLPLNHNLDWEPTMLLVRADCYNPNPLGLFGTFGIHQAFAGGNDNDDGPPFVGWQGAAVQNMTEDQVTLYRFANDVLRPQNAGTHLAPQHPELLAGRHPRLARRGRVSAG